MPIVADYDRGMEVTIPIFKKDLKGSVQDIKAVYKDLYNGEIVKFVDGVSEEGFLSASSMKGKDGMQISVFGNDERILLVSRFDNLGKGASGAAIQNMNIILGEPETTGLEL
jgi:N-acetyl-gamma-glutamyl-phosphate reductase